MLKYIIQLFNWSNNRAKLKKDGKKDGKWTKYYKDGEKKYEKNYKDGKKDGKWTEWDENGQIKSEATYKDGECVSGDCDYFK